jgi:two-component system LytT family response regulator
MTIKTLIIEEEAPARERLRRLLLEQKDIQIIGEAADGHAAVAAVSSLRPDLVFLDIRLPGLDGFSILRSLPGPLPLFIIISANANHASRAFDAHAVDYLLKPYTSDRLRRALVKARDRLRRPDVKALVDRLAALRAQGRSRARPVPPLGLKSGSKVLLIQPAHIDCIFAAGDEAEVCLGDERHRISQSLGRLQERLPADQFLRISRATLINVDRIKELETGTHGDGTVVLSDGTRHPLTRRYRAELDRLLNGAE